MTSIRLVGDCTTTSNMHKLYTCIEEIEKVYFVVLGSFRLARVDHTWNLGTTYTLCRTISTLITHCSHVPFNYLE